jgi:hypothetical protein
MKPQVLYMSPFLYRWYQLVLEGKTPYIARLRAQLEENRRRAAMPDGTAFWGIDRFAT